jgi:hypothetical protein
MKLLLQIQSQSENSRWYPITDQIRFGNQGSTAHVSFDNTTGIGTFSGVLKINDGAGFSSCRTDVNLDLSTYGQIQIPVLGDGRNYKVIIKDKRALNGPPDYSYQYEFSTKENQFNEIALNLNEFKPVFRGRLDPSLPQINLSEIVQIGFQINDKIQGPFKLKFKNWQAV